MSFSNFFKFSSNALLTPRLYVHSSNERATIIESTNDVTQLSLMTKNKASNSISFFASMSNLTVGDISGTLFEINRWDESKLPLIKTLGSIVAEDNILVASNRVVVTSNADVYSRNLSVELTTFTSNITMNNQFIIGAQPNSILKILGPSNSTFQFAFSNQTIPSVTINTSNVEIPNLTVGTSNTSLQTLRVYGKQNIDKGLFVTNTLGQDVVTLSDGSDINRSSRMLVFRPNGSVFWGIGCKTNMEYTVGTADSTHTFYAYTSTQRVETMQIGSDQAGNPRVGIGFTSLNINDRPQYPLHVKGNARFEGDLEITGNFTGALNLPTLDAAGRLPIDTLPQNLPLLNSNNKIELAYLPEAATSYNMFRSALNVGIGTRNPQQKLHVKGNMCVQEGRIGVNTTNPLYPIHVYHNNGTIPAYFSCNVATGGHHMVFKNDKSSNNDLYITHDGRIGMGREPGEAFKLDVAGTISATRIEIPQIDIDRVNVTQLISSGLTTNANFGSETSGVILMEAYAACKKPIALSVVESSRDDKSIIVMDNVLYKKGANYNKLYVPPEGQSPPLYTSNLERLAEIKPYKMTVDGVVRPSFLLSELTTSFPNSILQTSVVEGNLDVYNYGFSDHEILPHLVGATQELSANITGTSNVMISLINDLQNQINTLSTLLAQASNAILELQNPTVPT